MSILTPHKLKAGDTVGIFTPSEPLHIRQRERYLHGLDVIRNMGFQVKEGWVTAELLDQGHRTTSAQDRAKEFMDLLKDPNINALVATTGGSTSSSLLPYLDFSEIRRQKKLICGFSDLTAILVAIYQESKLKTLWGPMVIPSFCEWPEILTDTKESFLQIACNIKALGDYHLTPPTKYSSHGYPDNPSAWREISREYKKQEGWLPLRHGIATGELIAANTHTLLSLANTRFFPDLKNKILFLESRRGDANSEERIFRHLQLMGAFKEVSGLVISKTSDYNKTISKLSHENIINEIIDCPDGTPVITNFDSGHTHPFLSLMLGDIAQFSVDFDLGVSLNIKHNPESAKFLTPTW